LAIENVRDELRLTRICEDHFGSVEQCRCTHGFITQ
jgi:hypothetical protein